MKWSVIPPYWVSLSADFIMERLYEFSDLICHKYNSTTENVGYLAGERKSVFVHFLICKSREKLILSIIAENPFCYDLV